MKFNWRLWIISFIGVIGFILLIAEPTEKLSQEAWIFTLIGIKFVAAILIATSFGLAVLWANKIDLTDNSSELK